MLKLNKSINVMKRNWYFYEQELTLAVVGVVVLGLVGARVVVLSTLLTVVVLGVVTVLGSVGA